MMVQHKNFFGSLLTTMVLFTSSMVFAQATPINKDSLQNAKEDPEGFIRVEIEASYPGGDKAWLNYILQNVNADVPAKKRAPVGYYTVIIQFVVDKEGKITDLLPLTSHGYGMEEEVIRILAKAPRWKPAIQDGRPVRAYRKQPVTFQVEEEKRKKRKDG